MTPPPEPEILDPADLADLPQLFKGRRTLAVELTAEELSTHSEDLAKKWAELTRLKDNEDAERKAFNAEHKGRLAAHAKLNKLVFDKTEDREVEVITFGSITLNQRITVQATTYALVERRALEPAERERLTQTDMFPTEAPEVIDGWELGDPPEEGAVAAYYTDSGPSGPGAFDSEGVSLDWHKPTGEIVEDHAGITWPFADGVVLQSAAPLEALGFVNAETLLPPVDEATTDTPERKL